MPVEAEHLFRPIGQTNEKKEVQYINSTSYETLKIMIGLQLEVKRLDENNQTDTAGQLFVGNQSLTEDKITVVKYPNNSSQSGIRQNYHNPIRFSEPEVVEITSWFYGDKLILSHVRHRPIRPYQPPRPLV